MSGRLAGSRAKPSRRDQLDEAAPGWIDAAGADFELTPDQVDHVCELYAAAATPQGNSATEVLVDHLRQLVNYCRQHSAEPVTLTYPFRSGEVERSQIGVANELGVRCVNIRARFDGLLQTRARIELFAEAGDGHCNDAGYGMMAEKVAAALSAPRPTAKTDATQDSGKR